MGLILKNFIDDTEAIRPECFMRCEAFKSKAEHNGLLIKGYFYHSYDAYIQRKPPIKTMRFVVPFDCSLYHNNFGPELELEVNKSLLILVYDFLKLIDGTDSTMVFPELCINDLRGVNLTNSISTFNQDEINGMAIDGLSNPSSGYTIFNETTQTYQVFDGQKFINENETE